MGTGGNQESSCNCTQKLLYQRNMGSSRGICRNRRVMADWQRNGARCSLAGSRSRPGASAKPSGAHKARFKPKAAAPGQAVESIATISQKEYHIRDELARLISSWTSAAV